MQPHILTNRHISQLFVAAFLASGVAALGQSPAAITSPANHATLSTSATTFGWTATGDTAGYFLYVGTSQGANNIFGKDEGLTNTQTVSGLPNGTIWVRLWTLIGSTWWSNDYNYTEVGGSTPAVIVMPVNHATLSASTATFGWTATGGATGYFLYVGTSQGTNNIFGKDEGLTNTQTVSGLPNGTIWVRLWTLLGSTWQSNDYSYTEVGGSTPAAISSPANHSDILGSTLTLQWTPANGAADYFLYVGTSQGANNIRNTDEGLATTQTVNGLPNGTIWIRLWSLIGTTWFSNDYSYTVFTIGDDYLWKTANSALANKSTGFYYRNCTDFVAWRMNRDKGDTSPSTFWFRNTIPGQAGAWGDALLWKNHAQIVGYRVDSVPAVGAVAYFSASPGHVAYVESVNADGTVNVSEYNYNNHFGYGVRHNVASVTSFIHILR